MAARPRNARNRLLPPNLYQNPTGYLWYRNPMNGETFGLGHDLKKAISQARTVNAEIERRRGDVSLLARIDGGDNSLASFCVEYEANLPELKASTLVNIRSHLKAIREASFAANPIAAVTPKECADFLEACEKTRGAPTAVKTRSRLRDIFRSAIQRGLVELGKNPVDVTKAATISVMRARLSLDDFTRILAEAQRDPAYRWAVNAFMLLLITGQRREDIAKLQFSQIRDGFLWITQTKGKKPAKLCIPLSLRLDAIGVSLDELLRQCRDNVLSPHVVHFVRRSPSSNPGDPVSLSRMSSVFATMRTRAGIETPEGCTPTSLHELRSLSARLYTEQYGAEFAQALLGHKSAAMTALYRDSRGQEWTEIKLVAAG
ncbi:site-specific integrase [Burkholderia pyrrocinia]|uniref:site-specific integrase n=1 Tax=Burkholderia pyrrocinia TaxID=60550 RepID=UPI002AB12F98|nr:tyrosine-type recombinase/integrase [Burkholderia pyrrocinia]